GPVQYVAVDVIGAEVLERAGHRLRHLGGEIGLRIVRKAMILTRQVRVLRLQEQIVAGDDALAIRRGQAQADRDLEVVPPLVGGVDPAESRPQRELDQALRALLFPGGAVEEIGDGRCRHARHSATAGPPESPDRVLRIPSGRRRITRGRQRRHAIARPQADDAQGDVTMADRGIDVVRAHLAKLPPSETLTTAERRAQYERAEKVFPTPADVKIERVSAPAARTRTARRGVPPPGRTKGRGGGAPPPRRPNGCARRPRSPAAWCSISTAAVMSSAPPPPPRLLPRGARYGARAA